MEYLLQLCAMFLIYATLAMALNLATGYAGMLSLAHAAFFGIGAYAFALSYLELCLPFGVALPFAVIITAAIASVFAFLSVRLQRERFLLATLALQLVLSAVFLNCRSLTGGAIGISAIPRPNFFGAGSSTISALVFIIVSASISLILVAAFSRSRIALAARAARDDHIAAMCTGVNVSRTRLVVFMISAAIAGLAGVLYSTWVTYIEPSSFGLGESLFVFLVAAIGGLASWIGPVVGALLLLTIQECLRFSPLPDAQAADMRQLIYGLLLVSVILFRPTGLFGKYSLR